MTDTTSHLMRLEGAQLAQRLILAILIDHLAYGLSDQDRTYEISRIFNAAHDALDLASTQPQRPNEWVLAQARREVTEIAGRLLCMSAD